MEFTSTPVHISTISPNDVVFHNGELLTVGKNDISRCSFMGLSLFGDSYHSGYKAVILATNLKDAPSKKDSPYARFDYLLETK